VREITNAVGLELRSGQDDVPVEITDLLRQRDEARARRDFPAADALRDRLDTLGWMVEDTPKGSRLHRKER
ncbi:MAG: cysteine--tRNA ligase, partial [Actinomycetota bacterium]|nr:cysteine--tRNA ligase [Actinomycetota bacterium]